MNFILGCLFHDLQFETQHELKTEMSVKTWQVGKSKVCLILIYEINANIFYVVLPKNLLYDRWMCSISVFLG